jgi:hypothetical protein
LSPEIVHFDFEQFTYCRERDSLAGVGILQSKIGNRNAFPATTNQRNTLLVRII